MCGSGENGATQLPSLFFQISNRTPVLCLQLSSTPHFTLCDQAPGSTSLPSFVSDAAVFPGPLLPKDCGFDLLRPFVEGLTEQWPGAGHTQKHSQDHAAANAKRLQPGASLPQKKLTRQCSSSISGIMENHSTHLAPGFTDRKSVV